MEDYGFGTATKNEETEGEGCWVDSIFIIDGGQSGGLHLWDFPLLQGVRDISSFLGVSSIQVRLIQQDRYVGWVFSIS